MLEKLLLVVFAVLVGQALKRVGPYLGERYALAGGGKAV